MSTINTLHSNTTSLAPVANWNDHNPSGHVVQFYGEDEFLLDELSRFIGTALGAGEAAVVIATKDHRDGLARSLQAWGLDTNSQLESSGTGTSVRITIPVPADCAPESPRNSDHQRHHVL